MVIKTFVCPNCGNTDLKYIGYLNGRPYCRKCIVFKGEEADNFYKIPAKANYKLDYSLSDDQNRLSKELINNYKKNINTLVHAVCGSGKTEIVLEVIKYAIECGDKVGFAVPRRDVVIELHERFSSIFKRNKVALVYGGHTTELYGDLICLTTHQLYRYQTYFDLLIVDEVDAFPFKGSEVLDAFFNRAIKGKYILLSATPDEDLVNKFRKDGFSIVQLFSRFHGHALPVPKIIKTDFLELYVVLYRTIKKFIKSNKQVFVFTPTIDECEKTYKFLHLFFKSGFYVHSKLTNRNEIISDFKQKKYLFLVTTAVLERGVTVKDLQVIVFKADHTLYDKHALIQISGRVGRKKDAPEGEVIFIVKRLTKEIERTIDDINEANKSLQTML